MGYKLMQRRIQQTNSYRQTLHGLEDAFKVAFLERQKLSQCCFPSGGVIGKDHLPHEGRAIAFKEHVLSTAQSNAFSAKIKGSLTVMGCVSIGSDTEGSKLISPLH